MATAKIAWKVAWHVAKRLPRPLLAASAAGWLLLAAHSAIATLPALCGSAARAGTMRVETVLAIAPSTLMLEWLIMILAMMPPLLAAASLHVWRRSFPRRRSRALALLVLGYALVWLAAGVPLGGASLVLGHAAASAGFPLPALAGLVALTWQTAPIKQRCLNGCHHQPPLAAFGLGADADALSFGLTHGAWCVGTCWALMLLPFAAAGAFHWCMMAFVMLVSLIERARAPDVPRWRLGSMSGWWPAAPMPERRIA